MARPTKRYNVTVARKYKKSSGEDGKQWIRIGEMTEWDDGSKSMRLDTVPAGNWFDGKCYLFDADEAKNDSPPKQQRQAPPAKDYFEDDSIGF